MNGLPSSDELLTALPSQGYPLVARFLPLESWAPFLHYHSDQRYAAFLHQGTSHGFRIGCQPQGRLEAASPSLQSASDNPVIGSRLIKAEVEAGRMAVVKSPEQFQKNLLGAIPKPHQPGKFCMIIDLSAPRVASVNDCISEDLCSLSSVKQAARMVKATGRGAHVAKLDLSSV